MGGEPVVYADLLHEIKKHIRHAQVQAVLSANKEMILLYWAIGFSIAKRQIEEGWGAAIIPRLAKDIKNDMPEIKGFSERNLKQMVRFYREYPFLSEFVPQAVAQLETATVDTKVPSAVALLSPGDRGQMRHLVVRLPWGHNILLTKKIKDLKIRVWYMRMTIEQGWSILCQDKKKVIAEYALRGLDKPIGISEYEHPGTA